MNENLQLKYSYDETLQYFYIFIYNKYLFMNISCDMIDIYFSSNIIDIYFNIHEKYGITLLKAYSIGPDDLLIFLNHTPSLPTEYLKYIRNKGIPRTESISLISLIGESSFTSSAFLLIAEANDSLAFFI